MPLAQKPRCVEMHSYRSSAGPHSTKQKRCEMKTPANMLRKLGLASALLAATFGCSVTTPDQAAADARDRAADARADVVDANARVTAADAPVKAAEADPRVDALTTRHVENTSRARTRIPSGTVLKVFLIDD